MKKELRIGTWNMLTLHKGGTLEQLEKMLQDYEVNVNSTYQKLAELDSVLEKRNCSVCCCCQKVLFNSILGNPELYYN
jgi:hypothetical protein